MKIDKNARKKVNPQYLKRLKKIQKQAGIKFKSSEEFDKYFSE